MKNCYAKINLDNLTNNLNVVKNIHKDKFIMAVVKANAYGHGSIEVSKRLVENKVDYLAVATLDEAIELRKEHKNIPILILGVTFEDDIKEAILNNITLTIANVRHASLIDKCAMDLKRKAIVHVGIDTGMRRIGLQTDYGIHQTIGELDFILKLENLCVEGIYTHFASSDSKNLDYAKHQFDIFVSIIKDCSYNFKYIHCSNSAAIEWLDNSIFNMVRPGLILYGYAAKEDSVLREQLKPLMSWNCRITNIKIVPKNLSIGYSQKHFTDSDSTIATIPVGYADGYNRLLSNKGIVYINNTPCKVVGNVCMDQTMIDISHISHCNEGDIVTLMDESYSAEDIAKMCSTIPYEILCGISARVTRLYN